MSAKYRICKDGITRDQYGRVFEYSHEERRKIRKIGRVNYYRKSKLAPVKLACEELDDKMFCFFHGGIKK